MHTIIIYTDGGARNNPGPAGAGVVIMDGGRVIAELKQYLGEQTNNWAEYEALALALQEAKRRKLQGRSIEIRMDSKLVIEQIAGNWKVKEPTLKPQVAKARALLADFPKYKSDFLIKDTFIEFVGLEGEHVEYTRLLRQKRELVKKYGLNLIEIHPKDIYPENNLGYKLRSLIK